MSSPTCSPPSPPVRQARRAGGRAGRSRRTGPCQRTLTLAANLSDALNQLREALAEHYRIERELGAGVMATVYLPHAPVRTRRGVST